MSSNFRTALVLQVTSAFGLSLLVMIGSLWFYIHKYHVWYAKVSLMREGIKISQLWQVGDSWLTCGRTPKGGWVLVIGDSIYVNGNAKESCNPTER